MSNDWRAQTEQHIANVGMMLGFTANNVLAYVADYNARARMALHAMGGTAEDFTLPELVSALCDFVAACDILKADRIALLQERACEGAFSEMLCCVLENSMELFEPTDDGAPPHYAAIAEALAFRAPDHDMSKLEEPEASMFKKFTPGLGDLTFGSDEYWAALDAMPVLKHHYEHNRHHPQHFDDGICGMNIVDLIEMFCDWYASCKRHKDGDIHQSIEVNTPRFGLGADIVCIFSNTVPVFEAMDDRLDTSEGDA